MRELKSKDNTSISYKKLGSGPGLAIVGGSMADHLMFHPLEEELSKSFTVSKNHSVNNAVEDLEMLISRDSTPKVVYGHSAGAALVIRTETQGLASAKDAPKYLLHCSIPWFDAPTQMAAPSEIAKPIMDFIYANNE